MDSIFRILRKLETTVLIILMMALTTVSFLQVLFRVAFSNPLAWSEEASRYLFVWVTFLGAVIVLSAWEHFNIDFITDLLPKNIKKVVTYISYICVGAFAFILIKYGFELQEAASTQMTPALRINMSWVYSIIPISGILMIVHLLEFVYKDIRKRRER